ncbi:MAG: nicotinate-nucleotide adenylyltransferase [Pseudomonadota bacterium]
MTYLLAGKARCGHLIVGVTNPDPSLTKDDPADPGRSAAVSNPLTYYQRFILIREALLEAGMDYGEFSIVPFPVNRPELYRYYVPLDALFLLTIYDSWGRRKREMFESQGLKTEVMWDRPIELKGVSGAEIRKRMVTGEPWEHLVPKSVAGRLNEWRVPHLLRMTVGTNSS